MRTVAYIIALFIASATAQVQIPCNFELSIRGYECRLPDVDLSQFESFVIAGGSHLPGQSDATVVSFMSVNNNFGYFPTTDLQRFPNLQAIKISGSEIEELGANAVGNRPQLQSLSLSNNLINRIDTTAFQGTPNLRDFNLMFNRLRSIDNAVFAQLTNLVTLDLSFNILERIPANALINNPSLMSINFNSNRISHINVTFFNNFPNLTTFFFNANLCYDGSFFNVNLPLNLMDMLNRLQVCFVDTGLSFQCLFGFEFGGIDFDNRYTCLLREIEIYDKATPVELGGFHMPGQSNITVHYAWVDNSYTPFVINQLFTSFPNLQGVHITASNLQSIQPNAFQGANNLLSVTILLNNIRGLDANTFQHASSLQVIELFNNNLQYINQDAFTGLVNLRELHLIGGTLNYIPPFTFEPLISLQLIEISQNEIGVVDSRWFSFNSQLTQISFNFNRIFAMHPSILNLPLLTSLRLRENICINNVFNIYNDTVREQVRTELAPCFDDYPLRRRTFRMELEGEMNIQDENGTIIGVL